MTPLAVSYFLFLLIITGLVVVIGRAIERKIDSNLQKSSRLLVIVPQGLINPFREHRPSEIALSQELYRRLGEFNISFTLEVEVYGVGEEIQFFITVALHNKKRVVRLIETLWPTVSVEEIDGYENWHSGTDGSTLTIGYLQQRKPYSMPIEVAHRGHYEPFSHTLRQLSRLTPLGEGAALQWVVRPANPGIAEDINELLRQLGAGHYHISRHLHETFVITPENLKLIKQKVAQPLFIITARVAAASDHLNRANAIVHALAKTLEGRSSDQLNQLALQEIKQSDRTIDAFLSRSFEPAHSIILSAEELATVFHFPGPTTPIPKIRRH